MTDQSTSVPTAPSARSTRRRDKAKALLAAGLVLGVGAAVTLAAWNDSEYATGSFGAGTFGIQGSTDSTTYADHATSGTAATLTFNADANVSPGETYYAPFAVRLTAASTYDAAVAVTASSSGTVTGLTYQLLQTTSFGCTSSTTGTELVAAGTAVGAVAGTPGFTLDQGTGGAAGGPAYLCVKVTSDNNLTQGQTGTGTWVFTAESQS